MKKKWRVQRYLFTQFVLCVFILHMCARIGHIIEAAIISIL